MLKYFEVAVMFLIALTFANSIIFVFAFPLVGSSPVVDTNTMLSNDDVLTLISPDSNQAVSGSAPDNPYSFVGAIIGGIPVVGGILSAVGSVAILLDTVVQIGTAYEVILRAIFGDMGILWTFISLTIIPMINLIQILAGTYLFVYGVNAVRGGFTG